VNRDAWHGPLLVAIALLVAGSLSAQSEPGVQWEGRADVFLASSTTVQGGAAAAWFLDRNVRLVALGGAGSTLTSGVGQFSGRLELLGRFVLDPERTQKWALYGTGGIGVRYEAAPDWRGVLVALVGLEGPKWGSWTPFIEAGYGGGVQIGFGLRRARLHGR
jgi:hypothetical protein